MGMISPIKRGTAEIIYAESDGVFIKETKSGVYMLTVSDFDKGKTLVDKIGKPAHICIYQKDIADYFYKKHGYKKCAKNVQAVYTQLDYVEMSSHVLNLEALTLAHLDLVYKHFSDYLKYDYIKRHLLHGAIWGGFLDSELCGFVGIHEEGAIGMIKVLENFRGRGYASELTGCIVNIQLDKREIPFSQIEHDNEASIGLHKKLGFEVSTDVYYRLMD